MSSSGSFNSVAAVKTALDASFLAQLAAVDEWHAHEPERVAVDATAAPADYLRNLVLAQHLINFRQWHIEDIVRRKDVDAAMIADCKYRIDKSNQLRTDAFEAVDAYLVRSLTPFLPPLREGERPRLNTESLGMAVDRLSILALKIYHMKEQTLREDADEAHRKSCTEKLAVLHEQWDDLTGSVLDLVDEFGAGTKRPKAYYQFKMYNDPALNPQLYEKTK